MVEYGDPKGLSAMAKAVGIPAGITAKLILEGIAADINKLKVTVYYVHLGKIKHKGIVLPLTKDIYQPVLEELYNYIKPPTIASTISPLANS